MTSRTRRRIERLEEGQQRLDKISGPSWETHHQLQCQVMMLTEHLGLQFHWILAGPPHWTLTKKPRVRTTRP